MTDNRHPAFSGIRAAIDILNAAVSDAQRSCPERFPVPPEVDALIEFRDFVVARARDGSMRSISKAPEMSRIDPAPEIVAMVNAIDAAWDKYAQPITVSIPGGAGTHRRIEAGKTMGRLSFCIAATEVLDTLNGDTAP